MLCPPVRASVHSVAIKLSRGLFTMALAGFR
jgi:hypothetical protein